MDNNILKIIFRVVAVLLSLGALFFHAYLVLMVRTNLRFILSSFLISIQ